MDTKNKKNVIVAVIAVSVVVILVGWYVVSSSTRYLPWTLTLYSEGKTISRVGYETMNECFFGGEFSVNEGYGEHFDCRLKCKFVGFENYKIPPFACADVCEDRECAP